MSSLNFVGIFGMTHAVRHRDILFLNVFSLQELMDFLCLVSFCKIHHQNFPLDNTKKKKKLEEDVTPKELYILLVWKRKTIDLSCL